MLDESFGSPWALDSCGFWDGDRVASPLSVPGWCSLALGTGAPNGGYVRVPNTTTLNINNPNSTDGFTVALWYKSNPCTSPSKKSIIRKMGTGGGYSLEVGPYLGGGYCWGVAGKDVNNDPINDGL